MVTFPTTQVLDTFNQANGPLTSNWITALGDSALEVNSNLARSSAATFCAGYWSPTIFGPSQECFCSIPTTDVGSPTRLVGLVLRGGNLGAGTWNGYQLTVKPQGGAGNWQMVKVAAGAATNVGSSFTQAVADGDSIGFSARGSTLTAWYKSQGGQWAAIQSNDNTVFSGGGFIGLEVQNTTFRIEDFGGGNSTFQPAPTTRVLDTFDRPNGSPGPNWDVGMNLYPVPPIASNSLSWPEFPSGYWKPQQFGANQEAFLSIAEGAQGTTPGVLLRWTNPGGGSESGYWVYCDMEDVSNNAIAVWKYTAGLGSGVNLFYANGIMGLLDRAMWVTLIGNVFSVYGSPDGIVWSLHLTFVDSSAITGPGYIGLFAEHNPTGTSALDNFGGGTIVAGPTGTMRTDRRRARRTSW